MTVHDVNGDCNLYIRMKGETTMIQCYTLGGIKVYYTLLELLRMQDNLKGEK
jgi:hypothetical protein